MLFYYLNFFIILFYFIETYIKDISFSYTDVTCISWMLYILSIIHPFYQFLNQMIASAVFDFLFEQQGRAESSSGAGTQM